MSTRDVVHRFELLPRLDQVLAQHHDSPASLSRFFGVKTPSLAVPSSSDRKKSPSDILSKYRGKTLPLFSDLSSITKDFDSITQALLLNEFLRAPNYDLVGFFENVTRHFSDLGFSARTIALSKALSPDASSYMEIDERLSSLQALYFDDLVARFLEKWFRLISALEGYHNGQLADLTMLADRLSRPITGKEALRRLQSVLRPSQSSPAPIQLAFLQIDVWLASLIEDATGIEDALTQMDTKVRVICSLDARTSDPGENHLAICRRDPTIPKAYDRPHGVPFVQETRLMLGRAKWLSEQALSTLARIQQTIEALDKEGKEIGQVTESGVCEQPYCMPSQENLAKVVAEGCLRSRDTAKKVHEEWDYWRSQMQSLREKQ